MFPKEWSKFVKWLRETYGDTTGSQIVRSIQTDIQRQGGRDPYAGVKDNQYWQTFRRVTLGDEWRATLPPTSKDIEDMSPEERSIYYGELLKGKAQPTWAAPEGFEWVRSEFDPETNYPLAEDEKTWGFKSITGGEEAGETAIEQEGGYDVLVMYDKDGNRHVIEVIGLTDTGELSARDKEQKRQWGITHALKMDEAELQRQRDLSVGRWDMSQAYSRWMGKTGGGYVPGLKPGDPAYSWGQSGADLSRQAELKKAEDWDKIKEMTLGSLAGSPERNWLKTDIEKMTFNPYRPDPRLAGETGLTELQASEKQYESALASIDKRTKDETDYTTRGDPNVEWQKDFYRQRLNQVRDQIGTFQLQLMGGVEGLEDVGGTPSDVYGMAKSYGYALESGKQTPDWFGGLTPEAQQSLIGASQGLGYGSYMPPPEPTGTEVPNFLRQFVPGLTGKYIPGTGGITGRAPKITPFSPQQFRATSAQTRQKLAGYADFVGQDFGEMQRRMWERQPLNLQLGKNWRSAQQF